MRTGVRRGWSRPAHWARPAPTPARRSTRSASACDPGRLPGGRQWPRAPTQDRPAAVGDRVLVGAFGLEGIVKAMHDREAEVDVRGKRLRARVDELRVLGRRRTPAPPARCG